MEIKQLLQTECPPGTLVPKTEVPLPRLQSSKPYKKRTSNRIQNSNVKKSLKPDADLQPRALFPKSNVYVEAGGWLWRSIEQSFKLFRLYRWEYLPSLKARYEMMRGLCSVVAWDNVQIMSLAAMMLFHESIGFARLEDMMVLAYAFAITTRKNFNDVWVLLWKMKNTRIMPSYQC